MTQVMTMMPFWIMSGISICCFGDCISRILIRRMMKAEINSDAARQVEGKITKRDLHHQRDGEGNLRPDYYITYEFIVPPPRSKLDFLSEVGRYGAKVTSKVCVKQETYDAYTTMDKKCSVRYVASRPRFNMIVEADGDKMYTERRTGFGAACHWVQRCSHSHYFHSLCSQTSLG